MANFGFSLIAPARIYAEPRTSLKQVILPPNCYDTVTINKSQNTVDYIAVFSCPPKQ